MILLYSSIKGFGSLYQLADKDHQLLFSLYLIIIKKFNYGVCSPVSTPMDPTVKLMSNTGKAISQLQYSQAIGSLMYAMTSTCSDIIYAVGTLSRFTCNPGAQH